MEFIFGVHHFMEFIACRWTSEFLQVSIIIFDGSEETCPKYAK